MKNNKNDIFQSLTDKLEEKEFQYNPSHWEAAEKMISSKPAFWSQKMIAAVSGIAIVSGIIGYNLLPEEHAVNNVAIENTVKEIQLKEVKKEIPKEEIEEIVQEEKVVEKKEVEIKYKKETEEVLIVEKPSFEKEVIIPFDKIEEVTSKDEMDEEEFVEFIEENELKNNTVSVIKLVENKPVVLSPIIPNIFTPNGDGQNDYFVIKNIEEGGWNLLIFNQSGEVVFESANYNNEWDGSNLIDGTYIYKLYKEDISYQSSGLVQLKK